MTGSPDISLPIAMAKLDFELANLSQEITSAKNTVSRCLFGNSIPITDLPSMTSTTRTLFADSERAKSFDKLVILLALTPGAKLSSKRVITGPGKTPTTSALIPNSSNFASTKRETRSSCS